MVGVRGRTACGCEGGGEGEIVGEGEVPTCFGQKVVVICCFFF